MKSTLIFLFAYSSILTYAGEFVDESGKKLSQYSPVWKLINNFLGTCPNKIILKLDIKNGSFSRFNGKPPRIIMTKSPDHKNFKMILAHETSHVCLFQKTQEMSNKEQFRFFDEGLADILGRRLTSRERWYKKTAFKKAKAKALNGKLSFKLVQKWKKYFGSPPNVDFEAYMVGATFIYFITEKFGKSKLDNFFISIGRTQSLQKSIKEAFGKSILDFEKEWINYVKSDGTNNSNNL